MYMEPNNSIEATEVNPNEVLRENILEMYSEGVTELEQSLNENKVERKRPRGCVVISLWEEDESYLTSSMFEKSFQDLLVQAKDSNIDLDFLLVCNNGGGASPRIGEEMYNRIDSLLKKHLKEESIRRIITRKPNTEDIDAATAWDIPVEIAEIDEREGESRAFLIRQQKDSSDLNKGKVRALRDVSNFLYAQIVKGYAPDFVYQMDAETILSFNDERGLLVKTPFRTMYDNLVRGKLTAVGTKDLFAIMEKESGKPLLTTPVGPTQLGYQIENKKKFITLPGGALMSKVANYVSGMRAITHYTPNVGVEDYMYTKVLRTDAERKNIDFNTVVRSLNTTRHLNRTPSDWVAAIKQMSNWRMHARAVDDILPGGEYIPYDFFTNAYLVIDQRVRDSKGGKVVEHLFQIPKDLAAVPKILNEIYSNKKANINDRYGGVTWTTSS